MISKFDSINIRTLLICGGGNGMHVMVPVATENLGCRIKVYTPFEDEAVHLNTMFKNVGGIRAYGALESRRHKPFLATSNPEEAAADVDMVLMVLPAFAHGHILSGLAPYLPEGIVVGAMPARSGLEYQVCRILRDAGFKKYTVFGLQTLPWACRVKEFGADVEILGVKRSVGAAAIPRNATAPLAELFSQMLGLKVFPLNNMLALSLANVGQIIHPGIMFGLFKNYKGDSFSEDEIPLFYSGVDDEIADLLQTISDEIQLTRILLQQQIGRDLNFSEVPTIYEWLLQSYAGQIDDCSTLARAFKTNRAYQGLKAPVRKVDDNKYVPDFQSRYLLEDVPAGLVATAGLARLVDVPIPTIDEVISITSAWMEKEYLRDGDFTGSDVAETRLPQNYGIHDLASLKGLILRGSLSD